jgi:hypothetical protein
MDVKHRICGMVSQDSQSLECSWPSEYLSLKQ